jgi:hemerythrin-like domain-containing protein
MCDYCDCRTRPLLAELGRQHELITAAIGRLRDAVRGPRPEAVPERAAELRDLLEPHAHLEEDTLYTELSGAGISEQAMVHEHSRIDAIVGAAAAGQASGDEVLTALGELEGHIHREEYDLFPATHQLLDDPAWDRITARRQQLPA